MSGLSTADDACALLQPYFAPIRRSIVGAFEKYQKTPPEVRLDHDMRAIGSCMHCHIIQNVEQEFAGIDGIRTVNMNGLKLVVVREMFALHFKLVDRYGNARFAPTKQQNAFQSQTLELPNLIAQPLALRVGYVFDDGITEITHVLLVLPNGKRNEWKAMLSMKEGDLSWTNVTEQESLDLDVTAKILRPTKLDKRA